MRVRLTGADLIGAEEGRNRTTFLARDPVTGEVVKPGFLEVDLRDLNDAGALSTPALGQFGVPPSTSRPDCLKV